MCVGVTADVDVGDGVECVTGRVETTGVVECVTGGVETTGVVMELFAKAG